MSYFVGKIEDSQVENKHAPNLNVFRLKIEILYYVILTFASIQNGTQFFKCLIQH